MSRLFTFTFVGLLLLLSLRPSAQIKSIDSSFFLFDSVTINGKKFVGFFGNGVFYLTTSKGDTVIKNPDQYIAWEFNDFNKDGHKDVMLHHSSNTPSVLDLFIFLPTSNKFKQVKDFDNFPAPERITGTRYYYSYHKSGCADLNWDSDLFFIQNFQAIRIGNISGIGCNNSGDEKDGVFIRKVTNGKEILLKTYNIDVIKKYEDYKWGFIKEYWTKNYKLFL